MQQCHKAAHEENLKYYFQDCGYFLLFDVTKYVKYLFVSCFLAEYCYETRRKELMDKLFTNIGYITSQYDKDICLMKDNIKKLEVLTSQAIKSSNDAIKTFELRITGFKDLFRSFEDR